MACKDRICFNITYIKRLCAAIDEGHDVVVGYNENTRWDVGINVMQNIYSDPAEFYRLYASASTDWEAVIRRRSTMLLPIDCGKYEKQYSVGADCNFNQSISLLVRLAEMDTCSIRICRYDFDERFISPKDNSSWGVKRCSKYG